MDDEQSVLFHVGDRVSKEAEVRQFGAAAQGLDYVGEYGDHVIGENESLQIRQVGRQRVAKFRKTIVVHKKSFDPVRSVSAKTLCKI